MSRRYVYDSGALIAIDKGNVAALRRHETRLNELDQVIVPTPVAAQVVRDPRRQARLMLALRGCDVVPFAPDQVTRSERCSPEQAHQTSLTAWWLSPPPRPRRRW